MPDSLGLVVVPEEVEGTEVVPVRADTSFEGEETLTDTVVELTGDMSVEDVDTLCLSEP